MIGDYSTAPQNFYIKPPLKLIYEIYRVLILIRDNNPIDSDKYISSGELINGINFEVKSDGRAKGRTNAIPIKRINDYGSYAGVDVKPFDLVAPKAFGIRWTFQKSGSPLFLHSAKNESIHAILNDNFTTLNGHTALMQGMIFSY